VIFTTLTFKIIRMILMVFKHPFFSKGASRQTEDRMGLNGKTNPGITRQDGEASCPKDPVIDKAFCLDKLLFSIILTQGIGIFLEETRPEYGAVSRVTLEL
jgi:hypothetical protein